MRVFVLIGALLIFGGAFLAKDFFSFLEGAFLGVTVCGLGTVAHFYTNDKARREKQRGKR